MGKEEEDAGPTIHRHRTVTDWDENIIISPHARARTGLSFAETMTQVGSVLSGKLAAGKPPGPVNRTNWQLKCAGQKLIPTNEGRRIV